MIDIKRKMAIAEYRAKGIAAGSLPEEIGIEDFDTVTKEISKIADAEGMNPFALMMGLRMTSDVPLQEVTTLHFDEIEEAEAYCNRMLLHHEIVCKPQLIGHKLWKIMEVSRPKGGRTKPFVDHNAVEK